jgi:hypothetical protein
MANKSGPLSRIDGVVGIAWRSLVVGAGYVLFSMIGSAVAQTAGLPTLSIGAPIDPRLSLAILWISGVLFGFTLGPFAARLPLRIFERIGMLFVTLFMLNQFINVIEALFFTTIPAAEWSFSLLVSAIQHGGTAVVLALLFQPKSAQRGLLDAMRETFGRRPWFGWLARFLLAGGLYVPVYFLFGAIVAPFVVPYYQDPTLGLRLTIPGFDVILPLEVGRGLLYALTLFPLIALLRVGDTRSRWGIAFWIILVQVVLGAWHPMLSVTFWPSDLRLAHGLELTADCIVYGLLVVWLMTPGRINPAGESSGRSADLPADPNTAADLV